MRHIIFIFFLMFAGHVFAGCLSTKKLDLTQVDLDIGSRKLVFVALSATGDCWITNVDDVDVRRPPWSTFKIPHFLIARETGAVSNIHKSTAWDANKYPRQAYWPETWAQSHTLQSAFRHSAAWYFQELVPTVGTQAYVEWLARFDYGNQRVPTGNNGFWLDRSLTVSPMEQVNFLWCIATHQCQVSPTSLAEFELTSLDEKRSDVSVFAKPGAGPLVAGNFDGEFEGWYVGYARDANSKPVAAFALYAQAKSFAELRTFRKIFALEALTHLGVLPPAN